MAEEIEVIVDDTQEEVSLFVGDETGVSKHSELDLDDGTNPHGTTISDVDPNAANIAYTDKVNIFQVDQTIEGTLTAEGVKTQANDPLKVLTSDGGVTDLPVIPSNIAYTDEENIFTEDQTVSIGKKIKIGQNGLNRSEIYQSAFEFYISILDVFGDNKGSLWFSSLDSFSAFSTSSNGVFDLGRTANKWNELFLSSYANVLGVKSVENSATKVFATDGSVVDLPTGGEIKPTPYGYIYNKNSWLDVSDFIVEGNATAIISGSNINIGTTVAGSYDDIIRLDRPTGLGIYKQTIEIKVINAPAATTYGLGLGIRSRVSIPANAFQYVTRIDMSNGGNKGKMQFDYGDPNYTQIGSLGTAVSFSQNDILRITVEQDIDTIVAKVYNITTQEEQSIFYVYTLPSSPFTSNTGDFAIHILGGTYEMQLYKVETKAFKNSSLMCIGDSKTSGYNGANFAESYPNQLNGLLNYITNNSGGNDTTSEVLIKIPEIIELSPKKVLLNIGSNDKRYGITYAVWESNYDSIVTQLEADGIDVYHLLQLNENVLDFTDYNAHITSTYASSRIVDAGIISLYSDGVHPDYTGMDEIFMAIVSQIGDVI